MYDIVQGQQRNVSIEMYREEKLIMLEVDFCIRLTKEEIARLNSLTSEIKIDQFCLGIINNRWDN